MVADCGVGQSLGEHVESRADSMPFPFSLLPEQPSGDPTVVGLLLGEESSTGEVPRLEDPQLRKGDPNASSFGGGDRDPIEGALVGVESK